MKREDVLIAIGIVVAIVAIWLYGLLTHASLVG